MVDRSHPQAKKLSLEAKVHDHALREQAHSDYILFEAQAQVTSGGFAFTLLRKYKEVNMVPAMAINGLFITFVGLFFADSLSLSSQAMTYIVISSVLVAISFSLITIAPRYIPAPEVAIFFPMGTVIGTVLAWLILKEELSSTAVFGGIVVILTLFIHSIYSAKQSNN